MIGCEDTIESNTTEMIDSNGNRVYKHQLSYNLSTHEDLDAASGKISLFSARKQSDWPFWKKSMCILLLSTKAPTSAI